MPFAFWGEPGPTAELEVVLAEEIGVDGRPLLRAWAWRRAATTAPRSTRARSATRAR